MELQTVPSEKPARKVRARKAKRKNFSQDCVSSYARDVVERLIVAGPHVRAACKRHLADLDGGAKRGLKWDVERALYYIAFFENFLCLNGGEFEGKPFLLQPWQKFIVGSLFGWVWKSTGMRRFKTAYVEIGKGNGKSPLAAGVGLAGLIVDQEPRAEIYAAATKKDQAMILFRDAVAMATLSPEIAKRIEKSGIGERTWNIAYPALHSFFRPISSDDSQSGPRPHIALVDEVHEHKSPEVLDMLRRGLKGRRQPLVLEITNSGVDRNSICFAHHEATIKALSAAPDENGFDDTWFGYVCALDEGDDWRKDPTCWVKANPNLGVSIQPKYLEDAVREAKNIPSRANLIARLNFCEWTESTSAWINAEAWENVQADLRIDDFSGRDCYGGLDLSSRKDHTAAALFFPNDKGGGDAFVHYWTPEADLLGREMRDRAPYMLWQQQGFLNVLPGASIDYARIVRPLAEFSSNFQLRAFAYDRWRIEDLKRALEDQGIDLPLVEFGQGFKDMSPAVDEIERLILNGVIRIHRNPVLTRNAASAVLEEDPAGNRKFTKKKATGRIDGLVALTMAVGAAMRTERDEVIPAGYRLMTA